MRSTTRSRAGEVSRVLSPRERSVDASEVSLLTIRLRCNVHLHERSIVSFCSCCSFFACKKRTTGTNRIFFESVTSMSTLPVSL